MARQSVLRHLGCLAARASGAAAGAPLAGAHALSCGRAFASGPAFTRKDVIYNLHNTSDPEAEAAIKAFQREQFAAAAKGPVVPPAEPEYELASQIERKYAAAQVVESGIQNVAVPLLWDKAGGAESLKRYVAQLRDVGAQAGFAPPEEALGHAVAAAAKGAESLKDLLGRLKPYTSPSFHAALVDAATAVEAQTGAPVSLDGGSAGYKAFAEKVKSIAQAHKLPWQMLLPAKQQAGGDDETADKLRKDYAAWLQAAAVADAKAEVAELQAEATRLLDTQLSKSAEAVRKEQASALAAVARKLDASKGEAWVAAYKRDVEFTAWFDDSVAANPAAGPKATA